MVLDNTAAFDRGYSAVSRIRQLAEETTPSKMQIPCVTEHYSTAVFTH